jgi:hypothetical protein
MSAPCICLRIPAPDVDISQNRQPPGDEQAQTAVPNSPLPLAAIVALPEAEILCPKLPGGLWCEDEIGVLTGPHCESANKVAVLDVQLDILIEDVPVFPGVECCNELAQELPKLHIA